MPERARGQHPRVAVIGGSGFYEFLEDPTEVAVDTPFGAPSAPIAVGRGERPPGRVPASPRRAARVPASPDQLPREPLGASQPRGRAGARPLRGRWAAARRSARAPWWCRTSSSTAPRAGCRPMSTPAPRTHRSPIPYCPDLRAALLDAAGADALGGGTMVVIEGPRFSTRAESQSYAQAGWTVVNMTGHPEAVLARELGLCYATIALVTDLDAGVSPEDLGRPGAGVRACSRGTSAGSRIFSARSWPDSPRSRAVGPAAAPTGSTR